jgi:hypothetical protein
MNPSKSNAIPPVGALIGHTPHTTKIAGWIAASRCRIQPRTHISSLIASRYSDRLLARIIHDGSSRNREVAKRDRRAEP